MDDANIRALLELLAERQYFGIGLPWRRFETHHDIAHRKAGVITAVGREIKHLPKQVLRSPIVLEDLYKEGTLPDVVGHGGPVARDLLVVKQSYRHEQDFMRHGLFLVDLADRLPAGLLLSLQIPGRGYIHTMHVKSVNDHDGTIRLASASRPRS